MCLQHILSDTPITASLNEVLPMFPTSSLWTPLQLGAISAANRILMAPMTRNRADADGLATPAMAAYYRQRASAGLIVSEMTMVSATGRSYMNTPGLFSSAQVEAWRRVTDAVHASGGRIVAQLGHGGRISHPSLLPDARRPVAPSAITPAGHVYTPTGPQPYVEPRALDPHEIAAIVAEFGDAAARAAEAGFDGVELHAANGYLLDQFLRDGANQRTDGYGGDASARVRLLLEAVAAAAAAVGADRVGVRLSPFNGYNDMRDTNPRATFSHAAARLRAFGLAYLHVIDPLDARDAGAEPFVRELRARFGGPVVVNGSFSRDAAEAAIVRGDADAVSFGAPFLANPDLPWRLATDAPLNAPDPATFYAGGERGYIDYPALENAA
jgi:N-ethylmaleimide reductase